MANVSHLQRPIGSHIVLTLDQISCDLQHGRSSLPPHVIFVQSPVVEGASEILGNQSKRGTETRKAISPPHPNNTTPHINIVIFDLPMFSFPLRLSFYSSTTSIIFARD